MSQEKGGRRAQRTLNGFLSPAIAFSLKPHSFFPLLSARPSFMSARESLTELIGACAEIFWFQANWPLMSNYANWAPNLAFSGLLKPTFEEGDQFAKKKSGKLGPAFSWSPICRYPMSVAQFSLNQNWSMVLGG